MWSKWGCAGKATVFSGVVETPGTPVPPCLAAKSRLNAPATFDPVMTGGRRIGLRAEEPNPRQGGGKFLLTPAAGRTLPSSQSQREAAVVDEERQERQRQFSRRELLRAGMALPAAVSLPAIAGACGGGNAGAVHTDTAHSDHSDASSHTDHLDAAHSDSPHGDSHGGHIDSHSDSHGGHVDSHADHHDSNIRVVPHTDHADVQHADGSSGVAGPHTDYAAHTDGKFATKHGDSGGTTHADVPHQDHE